MRVSMFNLLLVFATMGQVVFSENATTPQELESNYQSECQVVSYLKKAGFPSSSWGTMTCIAKYESSWNCDAKNKNVDGSTDYGLFEINSYYWCSGDPTSKYDECGTSCSSYMIVKKIPIVLTAYTKNKDTMRGMLSIS